MAYGPLSLCRSALRTRPVRLGVIKAKDAPRTAGVPSVGFLRPGAGRVGGSGFGFSPPGPHLDPSWSALATVLARCRVVRCARGRNRPSQHRTTRNRDIRPALNRRPAWTTTAAPNPPALAASFPARAPTDTSEHDLLGGNPALQALQPHAQPPGGRDNRGCANPPALGASFPALRPTDRSVRNLLGNDPALTPFERESLNPTGTPQSDADDHAVTISSSTSPNRCRARSSIAPRTPRLGRSNSSTLTWR